MLWRWHRGVRHQAALTDIQFSKPLTTITSLTQILSRLPLWVLQSHNLTGSQHRYVLRSIGQHHLRMVPLQGRRSLNEWMNKADAWDCHRKKAQRHLVYWSWLRYRTWKLKNWMEITEHLEAPGFVESCDKGCGNMGPLSQGAALHHDACLVCAQGRIKQSLVSH